MAVVSGVTNQGVWNNNEMVLRSAALHYIEGTSDKVYHVAIMRSSSGFVVSTKYGRRFGTLKDVPKGNFTDLQSASVVFNSIVREKTGKGYMVVEEINESMPAIALAGTNQPAPAPAPLPVREAPVARCNLLNAVDDPAPLLSSNVWALQHKLDGERLMVQVDDDGTISGFNRRGAQVVVPGNVVDVLQTLPVGVTYDGELTSGEEGFVYHIFDVVDALMPFSQRTKCLESAFGVSRANRMEPLLLNGYRPGGDAADPGDPVRLVKTWTTAPEKTFVFGVLRRKNKEGVVLKNMNAPYTVGRPASGGNYLKFKFVQSVTCAVLNQNGTRRSVGLGLRSSDNGIVLIPCGNVTIPANFETPRVGALVEVRYLYANPNANGVGGVLYQPVYLGERTDAAGVDTVDALKYAG